MCLYILWRNWATSFRCDVRKLYSHILTCSFIEVSNKRLRMPHSTSSKSSTGSLWPITTNTCSWIWFCEVDKKDWKTWPKSVCSVLANKSMGKLDRIKSPFAISNRPTFETRASKIYKFGVCKSFVKDFIGSCLFSKKEIFCLLYWFVSICVYCSKEIYF